MATISDAANGLLACRDILRDKLAAEDVQDALAPFGNGETSPVTVVRAEDPENLEGTPRIVLTIENDVAAPQWGHTARQLSVVASVMVSDFSGALIGAENPMSLDTYLGQFLQIAATDYDTFNDAGLWGLEYQGPREGRAPDSSAPGSINQHRFVFYYDPTG
jgi:hypothetical protein